MFFYCNDKGRVQGHITAQELSRVNVDDLGNGCDWSDWYEYQMIEIDPTWVIFCVFSDTGSELHRNILAIILATGSSTLIGIVIQPKPLNNPAMNMRDPVDGAGSSRQPDHPLLGTYTLTICSSDNTI